MVKARNRARYATGCNCGETKRLSLKQFSRAARLSVAELLDLDERADALTIVQDYANIPQTLWEAELASRWHEVIARKEVHRRDQHMIWIICFAARGTDVPGTDHVEMVAREGIEPPTRGFSVRCSTN
jgi:hypothetical protein